MRAPARLLRRDSTYVRPAAYTAVYTAGVGGGGGQRRGATATGRKKWSSHIKRTEMGASLAGVALGLSLSCRCPVAVLCPSSVRVARFPPRCADNRI